MEDSIIIYTDGAARGNPGPGGYGVVLKYKAHEKTLADGYRKTTNNRMELLAVIVALESMKTNQLPVRIYTDSKYVADAINQNWIASWKRKNFKKVKNIDLWKRFLNIYEKFENIQFHWVKGHANNELNNRADRLAVEASHQPQLKKDSGYETEDKLF